MIIDGRKIARRVLDEAKDKLQKSGKKLRLAAVLVGESPELKKFIELKKKAAEEVGIEFRQYEFPADISNNQLREELNKICKVQTTHGVIIELPLPSHLNTQYLLNTIPEEKDVDALAEKSQAKFFLGKSKILPPSVETVKQIFQEYNIGPKGKTAAVFGYGLLVGKPVSHWLIQEGATVSVITEHAKAPGEISKYADIVISGVGKPGLITADMIKNGATIIDFGRDVDFAVPRSESSLRDSTTGENVSKKAGLITPPRGGVGPIVVAAVLKNLVELNDLQD